MKVPYHTLARKLAAGELHLDEKTRREHAGDKWFAASVPDAVALPRSSTSVAAVLKFAQAHRIPVTPRGAGYGYVGGCVPARGGLVLSLAKMNRIKEIDRHDFVAVVEPGVLTEELQRAVEAKGRFYPPDPASRANCTIGGNIATNAGGPRCLKYGVTREYVLGLEVALADGALARVGSRTHKNKTGFDLTKLFVGSEGMLGIVTEATLKLLPLPPWRSALAVGFQSMKQAVRALHEIFDSGLLPCALELADEFTLAAAYKLTGSPLLSGCKAHLITELDGQKSSVESELKILETRVRTCDPLFVQKAHGPDGCEKIWELRRQFSQALKQTGLTKLNEDIVVPRGKLEDLFRETAALQKKHRLPVACFGHAGDGNIHVNVMVDLNEPGAKKRADAALDDLFQLVLGLGGVISGEHGIGLAKKPWWPIALPAEARALHRQIKSALDPRGILNPGKFL